MGQMAFLTFGASESVLEKEPFLILSGQNSWVGNQLNIGCESREKEKNKKGVPEFFLELFALKMQKS